MSPAVVMYALTSSHNECGPGNLRYLGAVLAGPRARASGTPAGTVTIGVSGRSAPGRRSTSY